MKHIAGFLNELVSSPPPQPRLAIAGKGLSLRFPILAPDADTGQVLWDLGRGTKAAADNRRRLLQEGYDPRKLAEQLIEVLSACGQIVAEEGYKCLVRAGISPDPQA